MRLEPGRLVRGLLVVALLAAAGCTVQPLYSGDAAVGGGVAAKLAAIDIEPVNTRVAQEVRNHLIFGFTGGAARPTSPEWTMRLFVVRARLSAVSIQSAATPDGEPTAGTIRLTGSYTLTSADGSTRLRGRRSVSASFDIPRQEFAVVRAVRDAENRAARELAELLRITVAADLARQ